MICSARLGIRGSKPGPPPALAITLAQFERRVVLRIRVAGPRGPGLNFTTAGPDRPGGRAGGGGGYILHSNTRALKFAHHISIKSQELVQRNDPSPGARGPASTVVRIGAR